MIGLTPRWAFGITVWGAFGIGIVITLNLGRWGHTWIGPITAFAGWYLVYFLQWSWWRKHVAGTIDGKSFVDGRRARDMDRGDQLILGDPGKGDPTTRRDQFNSARDQFHEQRRRKDR